ncbi:DUF4145 domain-containing protein [uncultured Sphingomonas sp.]|uniref:DUF4145 domain-containing protein n=1 Tax=uncultured Sphingomonas sp. TaxID=158754 RepID=UPI0025FD50ED|nr:DUF4145 domain-containing protein [uncultured Sphingomonas sp.]
MNNYQWTCPHCDRPQTGGDPNTHYGIEYLGVGETEAGTVGYTVFAQRCLNESCNKLTLELNVHPVYYQGGWKAKSSSKIFSERLIPRGASVPQPEFIPAPIRSDYEEACLIRDLSPKASATLSRRCIQGMIRDFAGISKGTLDAEIKALTEAVDNHTADRAITLESVYAIDHVRKIGNIGAHMEKDINVIIDVDPGEAQALINLVELLLREWYVERHQRQERLAAVASIRQEKDQAKLQPPASPALQAPAPSGASDPIQNG